MVASAKNALDRVLGGVAKSLPVDAAKQVANLKLDSGTQLLLNDLADKAASGTLSDRERQEYLEFVEAVDFVAIFQAKARGVIDRQSK